MTTITSQSGSKGDVVPVPRESSSRRPWQMLFSRITLFAGMQAGFALGFYALGRATPWERAADWWPVTVSIANIICLAWLVQSFRAEGQRFWDLFRFHRDSVKGDLLVVLGVTVLMGPVAYFPNVWLGQWLFGSPSATLEWFVRPLPFWAVYASLVLFPITQGITELPTYFGFVMPEFKARGMNRWLALSLPALMLGFQHLAVPLLFDLRFIAWRTFMYLPFAFLTGFALQRSPRLLPYFAIIHILMNMSFATMFLGVGY